ncbi:GGDEF domain-containing protein [bacterium]|nr:GGDEF domain-containing protein [bacterium]
MPEISGFEEKYSFQDINDAASFIAVETDQKKLILFALKSVAYLVSSERVELLTLTEDFKSVRNSSILSKGEIFTEGKGFTLANTPYEKIINKPVMDVISIPDSPERLCLPIIGSREIVTGLLTMEIAQDNPLKVSTLDQLRMFSTMIGIALERSNYYHLAVYDGLTGLYNRRQFDIRLREELSRITRYGGDLGLLLADVDHFKNVNDTYGHQQGDTVLIELAEVFLITVRNNVDIACRYGGEEFIAILPSTNIEGSRIAAERFRQNCETHPFSGQEEPLKVTVSCGVATINKESAITPKEFIRRADEMLYQAKEGGRNQVRVWE